MRATSFHSAPVRTLNESPSEKEGKLWMSMWLPCVLLRPSMKVPPKRKGNALVDLFAVVLSHPSMKVPPKRKGNHRDLLLQAALQTVALNESPSEKEGKSCWWVRLVRRLAPSMKVPPKRKGNGAPGASRAECRSPQ